MQSTKMAPGKRNYQAPTVTKLKSDEAKDFLLYHARLGNVAAVEILGMVVPVNEQPK